MPPNKPPVTGQIVNRQPQTAIGRGAPAPEEELPEELGGASRFVDSVLGFFEGVGPERARFAYLQTSNALNCQFCGTVTTYRLQVTRAGEESRITLCEYCQQTLGQTLAQ